MGRVLCCADIHGNYGAFKNIQNSLAEDDVIFFLGDAIDRGPNGYQVMKEMIADPRWVYMKGNHEEFFEKKEYSLWYYNGGTPTIKATLDAPKEEVEYYVEYMKDAPIELTYHNKNNQTVYLNHAGIEPWVEHTPDDCLWSRDHFWNPCKEGHENEFIVHGHTNIFYLKEYLEGLENINLNTVEPYVYAEGHKICIDAMTFSTNKIILLDLDTFEYEVFEGDGIDLW